MPFLCAFAVAQEWEGVCPSPGPGSGTSRGAGSKFPETGTPGNAGALSSGPRPLSEVNASAPRSPPAPALPFRGPEHAPSLALGSLFLGFSLFSRPLGASPPCFQFIQTELLVRAPRTPAPQLGLGGALPASACTASLVLVPSLHAAKAPGGPGAALLGPATLLQTWARLRFAARSLPPPLHRGEAVT